MIDLREDEEIGPGGGRGRVGAVVVSFHPVLDDLKAALLSISSQVDHICVVDNGSPASVVNVLHAWAAELDFKLIALAQNMGIAVAQNAGIQWLFASEPDYVMLFDQDSIPDRKMVRVLIDAHRSLAAEGVRVAALGPVTIDQRTGRRGKFVRVRNGRVINLSCDQEQGLIDVDFLIASGTLIPMQALKAIGTMNDQFFIDHVDTEWCARAHAAGWRMFGVCGAKLGHALGDSTMRVWAGRWREIAVHSPVRDYYAVRNTILMLLGCPMTMGWRLAQLIRLVQFIVFFSIFVPPRRRRVSMMLQGVWHGIVGRGGAYSNGR